MCLSSESHVTFNNLKNLNCLRLCSAESLSPFKHLDAGPHTSVKEARRSKKETGKDERNRRKKGKEGKCCVKSPVVKHCIRVSRGLLLQLPQFVASSHWDACAIDTN